MSDAVKGIFGKSGNSALEAAQAEQAAAIRDERNRLEIFEGAQRKIRRGARRGMLSFVDENLGSTLGGS